MTDYIQEHPWVTKDGTDPLLSEKDNTAALVQPPSDIEVNHAITTKMKNLLVMVCKMLLRNAHRY